MHYRKLNADGDFVMGHGAADYLVDSPECVAQAVATRLRLLSGEWFLDLQEGTPYTTRVLGKQMPQSYDPILRARILQTEGVREITAYSSLFDGETRRLTVSVSLSTDYGPAELTEVL